MKYIAGRKDRGDIEISFEPLGEKSGIEIIVETSIERLYGDKLRAEILKHLDELGVRDCRIIAIDDGALPYVVRSRVEAAVKLAEKEEISNEG